MCRCVNGDECDIKYLLDGTGSTALKRVSDVMVVETWCTRAISRSVPVPGLLFQSEQLSEASYEIRVASRRRSHRREPWEIKTAADPSRKFGIKPTADLTGTLWNGTNRCSERCEAQTLSLTLLSSIYHSTSIRLSILQPHDAVRCA
jgi:hypothetical protein